jgi:Metallo-peptidase family M12B Reprolysin-like
MGLQIPGVIMRRIFFLTLTCSIVFASSAWAGPLWQPKSKATIAAPTQTQRASISSANFLSIELNTDAAFAMKPGQSGAITLPGGQQLEARLQTLKSHTLGGQSWLGWAGEGKARGRIIMTKVNGYTFAAITYDNKSYLIEPARNAPGYIIFPANSPELSEPDFGNDEVAFTPATTPKVQSGGSAGLSRPAAIGATGTVDVGIFYHSSMRDHWGLALTARLQFLFQNYDTALKDSGTGIRANLVHISEISGTLDKSNGSMLTDFSSGTSSADGDFSGVAAIRDAKGFDIAIYIRRFKSATHGSCGTGFVAGSGGGAGSVTAASAGAGFNVVSDDFDIDAATGADGRPNSASLCNILTMAHEIGHNMGNTHETGTADSGIFPYSHGHRVDGEFRTVMSRNSSTKEPRLGFYSTPLLTKCADTSGTLNVCGVADVADNVRSMKSEGKNVQLYKVAAPRVVSSVLPVSRSIKSDATATAFAVVINPGGAGTATGCKLAMPGTTAAQFSYQTTSAANALIGSPDTPVDIPAGGVQNFIFSITPGSAYTGFTPDIFSPVFTGADLAIDFSCTNRQSAESVPGLNTLSFIAETSDVMDVIALSATLGSDGIVNTGGGTGVFSVAVKNIGVGGTVTVTGEASSAVTATVFVCETVTATGACMAAPSSSVVKTLSAGESATFGFFVAESATIVADFAQKRVFARFRQAGVLRGATSVAVRTAP